MQDEGNADKKTWNSGNVIPITML